MSASPSLTIASRSGSSALTAKPPRVFRWWAFVTSVTAVLAGCETTTVPTPTARGVTYPASFIGVLGSSASISLFDSTTGRLEKTIASGADQPELAPATNTLFFVRKGAGCTSALWRLSLAGGRPTQVDKLLGMTTYAVSADGRLVAYTSQQCGGGENALLRVLDLRTGMSAEIVGADGSATGLAWAPDGQHLAVSVPVPPYGVPRIVIVNNPLFSKVGGSVSVPCPKPESECGEIAPAYGLGGVLSYVATIDPQPGYPCYVSACPSQRYVVTEVAPTSGTSIYGQATASGAYAAISAETTAGAILFSFNDRAGHLVTYRVVRGLATRLPLAVFDPQW